MIRFGKIDQTPRLFENCILFHSNKTIAENGASPSSERCQLRPESCHAGIRNN